MNKEELIAKLKDENLSLEEQINYRGQLIKKYKEEIKQTNDQKTVLPLRLALYNELKIHKEKINELQKSNDIPLPKRVGLKVKEIANSIELFKEKHDTTSKVKSTIAGAGISSLFAGAITVGIGALGGAPLTLGLLATAIPTICYCGLASVVRMPFTETGWTKLIKKVDTNKEDKEKIVKFMEDNVKNNPKLLELVKRKTSNPTEAELLVINDDLAKEYQSLIEKAPVDEIRKMLTFEKINILNEQKKIYENIKNEYIKSKRELTLPEFAELERKLMSTNINITAENTYLKDVLKEGTKDFAISAGTVLAARSIISNIFPQYAITDIASLSIPVIFALIGSINKTGNIRNQIQLEKEAYDKMKTTINREQLQEMFEANKTGSLKIA